MNILDKIVELLQKQNKNQKELTEYLGIHQNVFTNWKNGRLKSYMRYLPQIADFFNVSIDYLTGKEQEPPIRSQSDQEMLDRITECFDLCDGPRKAALCVKAEELAKETQNQVKQTS